LIKEHQRKIDVKTITF